ncbi:MAG: DUF2304 domain-containing protein [Bacilli bacterium]|nr:DUF2304 domain-containing protein [Bacilli bacterium]
MKNSIFIFLSVFVLIYIINSVRKKNVSIKESFWWFILSIIMLILSIFPYSIDYFAKMFNISYPPSLLFILCIIFLVFMCFRDGKRISELQLKIVDLSQELAILKEKINRK